MKYYKSDKESDMLVPQGVINMEQFQLSVETVKDDYFNVSLSGNDRLFQF